ncbi:hypothetical protein L2E82_32397 [Cichorium intybus]|uniref:Uncharacterized protein n=1 Tax=Cichorium intybus TaxID=13427 RepID=A0ACB9BFV5_CICIN|nr:hypothetical protein L2E82_32397 [Cichorium intybus]
MINPDQDSESLPIRTRNQSNNQSRSGLGNCKSRILKVQDSESLGIFEIVRNSKKMRTYIRTRVTTELSINNTIPYANACILDYLKRKPCKFSIKSPSPIFNRRQFTLFLRYDPHSHHHRSHSRSFCSRVWFLCYFLFSIYVCSFSRLKSDAPLKFLST